MMTQVHSFRMDVEEAAIVALPLINRKKNKRKSREYWVTSFVTRKEIKRNV